MAPKAIQDHLAWGRQKRKEILDYMRRPDVVPMPLLCAEACGLTRGTASNWIRKGLDGNPEYEFFARTALALRAQYIQKILAELLSAQCSTTAQKARQFLLTRLSQEDFEPPPIKVHRTTLTATATLPPPEESIEATVELLSLPPSED